MKIRNIGARFRSHFGFGLENNQLFLPQISLPANGVEFELRLDLVIPLEMVFKDGHNPQGWQFRGSYIAPQINYFRLECVGHCSNFAEVCEKLNDSFGPIPKGQWRESFKKVFPGNDGQGPIGFADPSWEDPFGRFFFPVLYVRDKIWRSDLRWVERSRPRFERWRWLIPSKTTS